MLWRPPVRSRLSHGMPWAREAYRVAAWVNTVMAVIMLYAAWHMPFGERVDFDASGFLFFLTSLPALFAWIVALSFAFGAAYCWIRMMMAPARREDPWS